MMKLQVPAALHHHRIYAYLKQRGVEANGEKLQVMSGGFGYLTLPYLTLLAVRQTPAKMHFIPIHYSFQFQFQLSINQDKHK